MPPKVVAVQDPPRSRTRLQTRSGIQSTSSFEDQAPRSEDSHPKLEAEAETEPAIPSSKMAKETSSRRKRSPPSTTTTKTITSTSTSSTPRPKPPGKGNARGGRGGGGGSVKGTRMTNTHVFFWGGPLSNWNLGMPFPGHRCLKILVPRLDELHVSHPGATAFSTRLLASCDFVCGEQWMMAVKGWLFERKSEEFVLGERETDDGEGLLFKRLRAQMLSPESPSSSTSTSTDKTIDYNNAAADAAVAAYWNSTIARCLRTTSPREHKALGRHAQGYDDAVWNKASPAVVVSCCVARAEADPELKDIYIQAHQDKLRSFVEGSPSDRIWGVGLRWDDARIDDPRNWKGLNRLGQCHDEASRVVLGAFDSIGR